MSNKAQNTYDHQLDVVMETLPMAAVLFWLTVFSAYRFSRMAPSTLARRRWLNRGIALCAVAFLWQLNGLMRPSSDAMALNSECSVYYYPQALDSTSGRVKIITYFDPRQDFGVLSAEWNGQYAAKWQHGFVRHTSGCRLPKRAPQWNKIALLYEESLRSNVLWLIWIDADALFTNFKLDVFAMLDALPSEKLLVVGRDLGERFGRPINTGFMAVRVGGSGRALLKRIWQHGAWIWKRYLFGHEQESLTRLMQEDAEVRARVHVLQDSVRMFSETVGVDDTHLWREGDLVGHAAGWPGITSKIKAMKLLREGTIRN